MSCFTNQDPIPKEVLAYFRAAWRDQSHDVVLSEYLKQKHIDPSLTQAGIARRLGKRPEQIHRWLGSSANLTSDTLSDLLLAISACVPRLTAESLQPKAANNYPGGPEWAADVNAAGPPLQTLNVGTLAASGTTPSVYVAIYHRSGSAEFIPPTHRALEKT